MKKQCIFLLLLLSSEAFASLDIINFLDPTKNEETNNTIQTNKVEFYTKKMDYLEDIQPIFDSRCVVCHSCYNSPCQLKLSSYEGVTRGATKELVYDGTRLKAQKPTRLFIDANSTSQWRKKSFFSVLENKKAQQNSSILMQLLTLKNSNPLIEGEYNSDTDLSCPNNSIDMFKYTTLNSHKGMPFGLPAISEDEYNKLASWVYQGQSGYTQVQTEKIKNISKEVKKELRAFEQFLNKDDAKHQMSARYIYEHLFLAHISFESSPDEFYELVRSYTPSPKPIDIVDTVLPYQIKNSKKFYYRFRKIHSTIVYKTHIVFNMSMKKLQRLNSLFIEPKWNEEPHLMPYTKDMNPFVIYAQIPATSRYQFLLDNAEYITRTFIRGPVCKGQIALNVIHDHFWVMFIDPKHDLTITKKGFLESQFKNLTTPIVLGNDAPILDSFTNRYIDSSNIYFDNKVELYKNYSSDGIGVENIWRGYKGSDAPVLTIHRHFDSASIIK
ncbi:MAG: fatty acid cis/trans isomerase, partial [Campylobacterota bacterium]|nr:fatty acid cis/trans isomerase [Campylobacterota bacterium]